MRLLAFFRRLFPNFFPNTIKWEDGIISTDLIYQMLYDRVVIRIRAKYPNTIQAPIMRLRVRIYEQFPKGFENYQGKVLPPNQIVGDNFGTLCLKRFFQFNEILIEHECGHAITGESGHPDWLYKNNSGIRMINV